MYVIAQLGSMQDLHSKTVLITGATNGIGRWGERGFTVGSQHNPVDAMQLISNCRETAFAMARLGATVVLGCRNIDAARDIISQIK